MESVVISKPKTSSSHLCEHAADVRELRDMSFALGVAANRIEDVVFAYQRKTEDISHGWSGASATAFTVSMQSWVKAMMRQALILRRIARCAELAADRYDVANTKIRHIWRAYPKTA
ncbi:MAG: WXG100 family type VII secretion target [Propionibacteriaceae bacterium]|jgi:WXG100 family type VII secretion target|nr:WXG100 family type VII secretion target [Propionibacteriaceae bacterium]